MKNIIIPILDIKGNVIGEKTKETLDKRKDIFETVYIRAFIGNKVLLSKIKEKKDGFEKINKGKWGLPVATIVRKDEKPIDAFNRACIDDIGFIPKIVKEYEREKYLFNNSSPRFVFKFNVVLDQELEGTILVDGAELSNMFEKGTLAETVGVFI